MRSIPSRSCGITFGVTELRSEVQALAASAFYVIASAVGMLPSKRALLLYTTGQYLFLFDPQSRQVDIYPVEGVESVTLGAPAG